jgi:hypothetical protein
MQHAAPQQNTPAAASPAPPAPTHWGEEWALVGCRFPAVKGRSKEIRKGKPVRLTDNAEEERAPSCTAAGRRPGDEDRKTIRRITADDYAGTTPFGQAGCDR